MTDVLLGLIPLLLTLLVLSRLIGDNPAYRTAQYIFVGASLGYAFVVVYHQVLVPAVRQFLSGSGPLNQVGFAPATASLLSIVPFVLVLFFLPRILGRQSLSWLANIPLALVFGVGAALALAGALIGTLGPQLLSTVSVPAGATAVQLVSIVLLAAGVITTLCYFYFTIARSSPTGRLVAAAAQVGRWVLMIAFGFFFAGALVTYLSALNDRLAAIVAWFGNF